MNKNFILSCPDIGVDRIKEMQNNISMWLREPALIKITEAFQGQPPLLEDTMTLAKWYLDFSKKWDYRRNQNQAFDKSIDEGTRWLITNDMISDMQKDVVMNNIKALGLIGNNKPENNKYDYVLVLGGAKLSCLLRTRLAIQSIESFSSSPTAIILLGSTRNIGESEREATNTYAIDALTEYDLFIAASKLEINANNNGNILRYDDYNNQNNSWIVNKLSTEKDYEVIVLAAPSTEPEKRRANSADTYKFFLEKFNVWEGSRLLLVTSQIYVPYQHMEAIRTIAIPHNIVLDTIGFLPEWGGKLQGMNEPVNYLQELRSTIQSINRFLDEYGV